MADGGTAVLVNFPASLQLRQNEPLSSFTTIGIGGSARYFIEVRSIDDLQTALQWARSSDLPVLVLGGGSNMLIADSGWPGVVLRIAITGLTAEDDDPAVCRIIAGAGEQWDDLVQMAVDAGLQGIECLSGIPGTVGASPIQNIGAYGQEVMDTVEWVEVVHRATGSIERFMAANCGFAYRWSRFKGTDRDSCVVTRVSYLLKRNTQPTLRYGDLTRYFSQNGIETPTLAQVRTAVIEIRKGKGMVIDATIGDSRSCGSFFMNPIVSKTVAERVKKVALDEDLMAPIDKMPEYLAGPGQVKLSAAWLMEKAGLQKGFAMGNVGLSSCHVLALVNRGGGTAAEVLELVSHVKKIVKEKFAVDLQPEPVFIGFEISGKVRIE